MSKHFKISVWGQIETGFRSIWYITRAIIPIFPPCLSYTYVQMIFQHRINISCYHTCTLLPKNSENACMERFEDGNPRTRRDMHTSPNKMLQESVIDDIWQWEKQSD